MAPPRDAHRRRCRGRRGLAAAGGRRPGRRQATDRRATEPHPVERERAAAQRKATGTRPVGSSGWAPRCSTVRTTTSHCCARPCLPRECASSRPPTRSARVFLDDRTAITDLELDRGRSLGPRAEPRLRRYRRTRRGLRGRPERHDEPGAGRAVHVLPGREQPRPADPRDHQEHRGQRAARPRPGLRPVLRQQLGQRRAALGRQPGLHGHQPELPPQQRAGRLRAAGRRRPQGLPGAAVALPDDRPGGRQLLAGRRRQHPAAVVGVREPQGFQHPRGGQPRRHRGLDVG